MRLVFLVFFFTLTSHAEYRAFELVVVDQFNVEQRVVHTTLDQHQYVRFHSLNFGERIVMARSWMCWERTDHFKPICTPPEREKDASDILLQTDGEARKPAETPKNQ